MLSSCTMRAVGLLGGGHQRQGATSIPWLATKSHNASPCTSARLPQQHSAAGYSSAEVAASVVNIRQMDRRAMLLASTSTLLFACQAKQALADANIEIVLDEEGFGKRAAQKGDLLLLHYVGKIKETGEVFDSTRGGLTYRDGGPGTLRPIIIRLGNDPVPGICAGLKKGIEGMRIGGKRTFDVPPELGFRNTVLAPYAIVPAGSTLTYDVELIRLSARGPDELTKGIDRCGQGGAAQQVTNCAIITPAEFLL